MCGRVIQSSPLTRLAIVEGLDVRDSRFRNYPPRWNGAPSQELLAIRRNHHTGEASLDPLRWGLIPYWCEDPKGGRKPINAKCETARTLPTFRDAYRKPSRPAPIVLMLRRGAPAGCARTRAGQDPAASSAMPPAMVRRKLRRPFSSL